MTSNEDKMRELPKAILEWCFFTAGAGYVMMEASRNPDVFWTMIIWSLCIIVILYATMNVLPGIGALLKHRREGNG